MSGFLWAYTPEVCDGDICVFDCDKCGKAEEAKTKQTNADRGEIELTIERLKAIKDQLVEAYGALQSELRDCRNELCLKCGNYHEAHNGACNGCRWRQSHEKG